MSGVFKAIGKVFKSVVKVVKNVVKGVVKVVKKLAPAALLIGGIALGGALLTGGLAAGGGGIFSSVGGFLSSATTSISQGFSTMFGGAAAGGAGSVAAGTATATGAAGAGTAFGGANLVGTVGSGTGLLSAVGTTAYPTAAIQGLGGAALSGAVAATPTSGLLSTAKNIGGFIKDNKELVKIGADAIGGVQEQKNVDAQIKEDSRQFDAALAQRQAEDQWNGAVYGVDREGNQQPISAQSATYNAQTNQGTPNDENDRLDQIYQNAINNSGLLSYYDTAFHKQQG